MRIFIAFASEDRQIAEQLYFVLVGAGYDVFYDKARLPGGGDFNQRIFVEIGRSDVLIFLVSPSSVEKGNYALTELRYAQEKWPHPKGHVVPVVTRPVVWNQIPSYLTAVTVLEPEGNLPAEVALAVRSLTSTGTSVFSSSVGSPAHIVRLNFISQERNAAGDPMFAYEGHCPTCDVLRRFSTKALFREAENNPVNPLRLMARNVRFFLKTSFLEAASAPRSVRLACDVCGSLLKICPTCKLGYPFSLIDPITKCPHCGTKGA